MSIGVTGVVRVTATPSAQNTPSPAAGETAAAGQSPVPSVEIDAATQQPKPLRFPWLSRLTSELEPSAKQKPTFPSAPPLGGNVDQAA